MTDDTAKRTLNHADYAGFWVRFLAACVDMILYIPFYYGIEMLFPQEQQALADTLFCVFALVTYAMFFASPMHGSPGMYILRFHICDTHGSRISFWRALFWGLTGSAGWALCFAGVFYLQSRFDIFAVQDLMKSCQAENMAPEDCAKEVETMVNIPFDNFMQLCYVALGLALFLLLIWALSIALPKDKTGFHNLICGTRFMKGRV